MSVHTAANFTVVNATPEDHLVTVSKSTILTFACWTWCGYVDWSTIEFSAAAAEQTGASQYTCRGEAGPCMPSRENPTCTGIQPGRDSVLKFELSLRVKDTFYIECLPQCTFQMADKQVGRTKGLLVRVTGEQKINSHFGYKTTPVYDFIMHDCILYCIYLHR